MVAAIAAPEGEIGEHLGHALVEDRAGCSRQALWPSAQASQLSRPGRPFDDQVLRFLDPAPSGEALEQGAIEAACGA